MAKKLNSKKKIIIAVSLLAVLLVGAIVSVVLVLAANQQGISSNITVSYSVDGVGARVSARYGTVPSTGSVTMNNMKTSDGENTELVFNVGDAQTTETLMPDGNIVLSQTNGLEVVFEYRFQNIAETAFTIGLTTTGEEEVNYNITETYYVSTSQLATSEYGRIAETMPMVDQPLMNYDDIVYVYVKVAVANENLSAAYNKEFKWDLSKIETTLVTVTLNDNGGTNGLTSVETATGAATPVLETLPTAPEGQGFVGYFDATSGGTQYISKNGIGLKEITGATTLYAQYSEEAVLDVTNGVLYGISPTATNVTEVTVSNEVTEIAESAFENNTEITSVSFGDTATASYASGSSLKKIGKNAFKGCTGLTELIIPEGVTSIKEGALQNLTNLTHLVIPSTVTSLTGRNTENAPLIGTNKLETLECNADVIGSGDPDGYCSGLALLYGYYDYDNYSLVGSDSTTLKTIVINGGTKIGESAFCGCKITTITILNCVNSIGYLAFGQCSLTSITIPDSVTIIQNYAFLNCKNLISITIPNSVKSMVGAFDGCSNLVQVKNLSGQTIDEYIAPSYAEVLTTDTVFSSSVEIGEKYALFIPADGTEKILVCSIDETITTANDLPSDITQIGQYAFSSCSSLTSITIPNSVTSIGSSAFFNCSGLTSITIPDSVTSIGSSAFQYCTNLTSITIPSSLTSIGNYAFYNCTALTEINWNVKKLSSALSSSNQIFYKAGYSSGAITLNIGEDVEEIPAYLFYISDSNYRPKITSVVLPENSTWAYSSTKNATSGTSVDTITANSLISNLYRGIYYIRTDN